MFIAKRDKEDNYYKQLQDTTLERIEQLCGKKWTDYNAHDPGITIADYFNYALLELHYRLSLPAISYLQSHQSKAIQLDHAGLLSAEEVFVQGIVTETDYEELFKSRHGEIKACRVKYNKHTVRYDVFIQLDEGQTLSSAEQTKWEEKIKKTYHQHRNLCENIGEVSFDFDRNKDPLHYAQDVFHGTQPYEYPRYKKAPVEVETNMGMFSKVYESIQYDFPENYGIGQRGAPLGMSIEDKSKIMQLKAYLLIIDLVLADTIQQASLVKDLLDFSGKIPKSSVPEIAIPGWEEIVDKERESKINLNRDTYYNEQKSNYLDLLDIIYGEDTDIYAKNDKDSEGNEKRAKLIRQLPQLNAIRFKSFNVNDSNSVPTIQLMIDLLTDHKYISSATDTFNKYGLRIISDEEFFDKYTFLKNFAFGLEINDQTLLRDIAHRKVDYGESTFHLLRKNINLLWYNVLFESFLKYADNSEYYKILILPENEYLLVFKHPERNEWINMGLFFKSMEALTEIANLFWEFMKKIKHKEESNSFYFIEHLLLEPCCLHDKGKLAVVAIGEAKSREDKQYIEELLAERLPAHIHVQLYYVPREQFNHLEHLYFNWRKALAQNEPSNSMSAGSAIRRFLSRNTQYAKTL
jgi:hypothetical protein